MSSTGFYRAFEERFYAPRSMIKELRKQYLPFIEPLRQLYPGAASFDIGCGRGEWLELMLEHGFNPFGMDLDEGMLQAARELKLPALQGDAVAHLRSLSDESMAVISAFHVVEHITFEQLRTVITESKRVLMPGGLLIMETPNPENIVVATRNFYLDPTHIRPIPPMLLQYIADYEGYARSRVVRLQERPDLRTATDIRIIDILSGVSPDYAVVAQKSIDSAMALNFDAPFNAEYGVNLDALCMRYESFKEEKISSLVEMKGVTAELVRHSQDLLRRVSELDMNQKSLLEKMHELEGRHDALLKSSSWRITAPLRKILSIFSK